MKHFGTPSICTWKLQESFFSFVLFDDTRSYKKHSVSCMAIHFFMFSNTLLYVLLMHSSSSLCLHITISDLRPYLVIIMLAASMVITGGHFTFVRGLYSDIWINILFHPWGKVTCIINRSCKICVNMYLCSDIHCYNSKCISMYNVRTLWVM